MYVCMYKHTRTHTHTHTDTDTHTHTHIVIYHFVCGARGDGLFSELDLGQRLVMFLLRLCIVCVCVRLCTSSKVRLVVKPD